MSACTHTHTRTYLECISRGPGRNTHFKNKAHCAANTLERRILNRRGPGRAGRLSHRWRGGREAASQWHLCCAASLRMKFLEGSETLPCLPARAFCSALLVEKLPDPTTTTNTRPTVDGVCVCVNKAKRASLWIHTQEEEKPEDEDLRWP